MTVLKCHTITKTKRKVIQVQKQTHTGTIKKGKKKAGNAGFEPSTGAYTESSAPPQSQKTGARDRNPGKGMPPEMMKTRPFHGGEPLFSRGPSKTSPGGHRYTPPLAVFGYGAPSFAGDTEGCCLA